MEIMIKKTIEIEDMVQSYIELNDLIDESFIKDYLSNYDINYTELDIETQEAINNGFIEEICKYLIENYIID